MTLDPNVTFATGRLAALVALTALAAVAALAACGDDAGSPAEPGNDVVPDIVGEFDDGFAVHRITARRWNIGDDVLHLVLVDNEAGLAIARNGTSNAFSPGLWSRLDWTTQSGRLGYCQIAFDAPTRAAALATAAPDASDPANGGCSGFSWSTLVPVEPEIEGNYSDGFADHTLVGDLWTQTFDGADSVYHLVQVSNASHFAIARNDDANVFGAGLWSRFDWVRLNGDLWYCQTVFDAATRAAAYAAAPADSASPSSGGCGGFPWSPLVPR